MQITIFEENGFKKQIEIDKAVTRIGSSPASDIQLRSPHVSPFHLQVLYTRDAPDRCKIINLAAETASLFSNGHETPLAAYAATEALGGDELQMEGFRLRFELPLTSGTLSTSHKISASIALPEPVLRPNATLLGRISLKNEGENTSCQFQVEVSGFSEDCYQIDPVPLIYAGGQEEVNIRFFHRQTRPQAGFQSVTISVTAPESYPGEQVSIQQGIYVAPMLEQTMVIRDDTSEAQPIAGIAGAATPAPTLVETEPEPSQTVDASASPDSPQEPELVPPLTQPAPALTAEPDPAQEEPAPALAGVTQSNSQDKPALAPRPLPSKAKVVRTPAESFWDE
ncbi:MAG: hypothetical protein R6W69_13230 [Anaerolineales bacterium]